MNQQHPNITIPVDLTNPGQFFACCGLLELADRLWPGAEGWFEGDRLFISCRGTICELIGAVVTSPIGSSLSADELKRLGTLLSAKKSLLTPQVLEEKAYLQAKWRSESVYFKSPTFMSIDWWHDEYGERQDPKTWAAKQFVLDILNDIREALARLSLATADDLWGWVPRARRRFYFDSDVGAEGTARDVGFSFDPLSTNSRTKIHVPCRPCIELLAFIGLQRCRPRPLERSGRFVYTAWSCPVGTSIVAAVASASISVPGRSFEFRLFDRTEYFKSFLPAIPFNGESDV
ncbi:MAG TPA: type I-U CRISPR-associated protein Cas8c [Pirellulaceae bacterium]|nr:type I-U CRISPR-associated protein Cas8c [Pirellulaceae bacterium]